MKENSWLFRPAFYIVMALYFILGFVSLTWGEKWAAFLYPEDHYFENIGAISLFVASAISLYIFIRAYKNRQALHLHWFKLLVYLGLAGLYFFGGGEEISWGQRIFHIGEPAALAAQNAQDELNIHNLKFFEKNELLKADTIFTVFWMAFAVILPAGALFSKPFKAFAERFTPIVHWGIGLLFLFNYALAKLAKSLFAHTYTWSFIPFPQAVQEIKESNYELMFVFLSLLVLWELNHRLMRVQEARERDTLGSGLRQPEQVS